MSFFVLKYRINVLRMNDYSLYDYNENESMKSYDYFEEIEKEQNMNPALFSDPFIEIDELKFKNQMLFDKISSISAQSYTYQGNPSNLDFSDDQINQKQRHQSKNLNKKAHAQQNKKKQIKPKSKNSMQSPFYDNPRKRSTEYQDNQRIPKESDSSTFSYFSNSRQFPSFRNNKASTPLSFKERYNLNLNPKRSKSPERNLIKRATEMQEKLVKMKKENEKLNKNYRSMLYKVYKTKNDVEILKDALATSHFERLVLGHYEWSNYAEKSF